MTLADILFLIALIIVALFAWLVVPTLMIKRNMHKVIAIFRQKNAIGIQNAKTAQELGLVQKPFLQRMGRLRDYKPKALEYLIQMNAVCTTEDGKLYITEQSLDNAAWLKLNQ